MTQGEQIASVLQQFWNWTCESHRVERLTHNVMQIAARCAFNDGEIYVYPRSAYLRSKLLLGGGMLDLSCTSLGGKLGMVLVEINNDNTGEPSAIVLISDEAPQPSLAVPFDVVYGEKFDEDGLPMAGVGHSRIPELLEKTLSPHDYENNFANTVMWMATGPYRSKLIHLPLTSWEKSN